VLLRQAGIGFEEVMVRFDSFDAGSTFKTTLACVSPVGRVPVLVDDGLAIWDTLAIAEYVAETFPAKALWPAAREARARARSICAEMHAGFSALRSHCPMNVEAFVPGIGAVVWRDQSAVRGDVARLVAMWTELLDQHGGPMLFGGFSIADAYFAPVCLRLKNYALPVPEPISAYIARVCDLPGVKAWIDDALEEKDFLAFEEPYRLGR
jgi:glutathione S-transferase